MEKETDNCIIVRKARVNNLKNISVEVPREKLVVVTGVSGSGKSSLAFDTLYAEGQRRYVESLSAYARQFLGRMAKPECDYITGLPPAIAIEQKVNTRNPRSTVGTATEIYDYLRMLFGRLGRTYSPVSGKEVKRNSVDDVVRTISSLTEGTRIAILTEIRPPEGRTMAKHLEVLRQQGYSRIEVNGEFLSIDEALKGNVPQEARLVIDRLSVSSDPDELSRLADSVETAYFEGRDELTAAVYPSGKEPQKIAFSRKFAADGIDFREPSDLMFNFNNPFGACPTCEGFGRVLGVSEDLVVPDKTLSVVQDAIQCWRGEVMSAWKKELVHLAPHYGFPVHKPYLELNEKELRFLWQGEGEWKGIDGFFRWVDEQQYKIQYRVLKARYRGKTICPSCRGSRLRPDVNYVKVGGRTITELVHMPVSDLSQWFDGDNITFTETETKVAKRLLQEIRSRLHFLCDVGLGYLTLDRLSSSLSGGESQRINLATSLGSALVGSLYILDEPSIGLHPRDTDRLINVLKRLRNEGNTVVVVEHDEEIMNAADYLIDVGPDAGRLGGEIVFAGSAEEARMAPASIKSHTLNYLNGRDVIPVPRLRRPWRDYIEVVGARENNLKGIDVRFPLKVLTVVTGVSGSGKSTLVRSILYRALMRHFGEASEAPGAHNEIRGSLDLIGAVEFVDQNPIGTSTRSNPATYLKAFDEIRRLYSDQQLSKQMGYTPGYFSFNSEGGRCEECKGEGVVTIPMQFMADISITCEACHGRRYRQEVLDVEFQGRNIADVLDLTVDEAIAFFSAPDLGADAAQAQRIVKRLQPLADVGLGYIKLGQPSSTLSGGENQRVKLAHFLAQEAPRPTLFIFDEPTTGLHFHDISRLMKSLSALVGRGHTVLVIEHNLDVIKLADHVIDLGPEGGDEGGRLVAAGTPEEVAACPDSLTGRFLANKLKA